MKHLFSKKRLRWLGAALGLMALALLCAAALLGRHENGTAATLNQLCVRVGKGASSQTVQLWREGQPEDGDPAPETLGDGWFFLPSYAGLHDVRLLFDENQCTVTLDGAPAASGVRLHGLENGTVRTLTFTGADGQTESLTVHFMQSAQLASLFIDTDSGSMAAIRADKEYREPGRMKLVRANGRVEYNGGLEYLSGRGNQTWTLDKRGYGLKLSEAADLLGMGRAKRWVLLANAFDDSMLRNTLSFEMARALELASTPDSQFCDLYLNGVYAGTYQLTEKVEIGEERVDILDLEEANRQANDDMDVKTAEQILDVESNTAWSTLPNDPADITGGYLLERDYGDKYQEEMSYLTTEAGEVFVLRSPAAATKNEVDYIEGVLQQLENAVLAEDGTDPDSGAHYTELLDVTSWAGTFLVDEFTKNEGAGASSAWYYKNSDQLDGRIYSGPIWDYDKSLGRYLRWASPMGLTLMDYHDVPTPYFAALYQQPEFYQAVVEGYREKLLPYLEQLLDSGLDEWQQTLEASWQMDHARWGSYYGWLNYYNDASSLQSCVDYLRGWIEQRRDFLSSLWLDGDTYYTVKLDGSMRSTPYYYLYAKAGQPLAELPDARDGEGEFLYWVEEGTDQRIDTTTPITHDMRLQAVWSGDDAQDEAEGA